VIAAFFAFSPVQEFSLLKDSRYSSHSGGDIFTVAVLARRTVSLHGLPA
jgi:hypothetical protein